MILLNNGKFFKVKEAVKLWLPVEIANKFVCNFVELNNGTFLVKIVLYMNLKLLKSFRRVKKTIFTHLKQEKLYFHTFH